MGAGDDLEDRILGERGEEHGWLPPTTVQTPSSAASAIVRCSSSLTAAWRIAARIAVPFAPGSVVTSVCATAIRTFSAELTGRHGTAYVAF